MSVPTKIACLAVLSLLFTATAAFGQNSLYDNPNYRKSLDLQRSAKSAYDIGDYQKAEQDSREAARLSTIARQEAEIQRLRWIANSWKNRAATFIAFGEKVNAPTRYPDIWPTAKEAYALAVSEFDAERYDPSTAASKKVVELLSGVVAEQKPSAPVQRKAEKPVAKLPASYTVRLIPDARDCFWRIAAYPFVYGNPLLWKNLYEANKDKLQDPGNPDLIQPGLTITIPSVSGETREGTWKE